VLALVVAAGCQGGAPADTAAQHPPPATPPPAARLPEPASASVSGSRRTAVVTAVARVAPSVVTVQTESVEQLPADPFDAFFGRRPGEQRRAGIGSGLHRPRRRGRGDERPRGGRRIARLGRDA
jgi:S1-C subfamily serine protease